MKPTGFTANADAQAQLRRLTKDRDKLRTENRAAVLLTPAGRAFVWSVITETAEAFAPSFMNDSHLTAYNEGRRAVGLSLMLTAQREHPELYLTMLTEATQATTMAARLTKQAEATPNEEDNG